LVLVAVNKIFVLYQIKNDSFKLCITVTLRNKVRLLGNLH